MFLGWKIVGLAFLVAFFAFGLGFASIAVYRVTLDRLHGWPIASISLAITVSRSIIRGRTSAGSYAASFLLCLPARWSPRS